MSKLLVAVLIVCVAGAAFWFGRPSGDKPVVLPETPSTGVGEGNVSLPKAAKTPAPASRSPESRAEVTVTKAASEEGARLRLTIRVVDAATGLAVPGAEVLGEVDRALVDMTDDDRRRYRGMKSDLEGLFEVFGELHVADAKGEVKIDRSIPTVDWTADFPVSPLKVWVARSEGRYGEGQLKQAVDGVITIKLERDRIAHVVVLDAAGKPAPGASVVLRASASNVALGHSRAWRFESDDRGRVELHHIQRRSVSASQDCLVSVNVPGVSLDPIQIDVLAPPTQPIVFQLPATGSIEVRVLGKGGALLETRGSVDFILSGKEVGKWSLLGGSALIPHVGLGLACELRLTASGVDLGSVHLRGPVSLDEKVVHNVDLGDRVLVSGSLLDQRGRPVVRCGFELSMTLGTELVVQTEATDEAGNFVILVDAGKAGRQVSGVRVETYARIANPRAGMRASKQVDMPFEGELSLGSFRLADLPLLASGRVVDGAGKAFDFPHLVAVGANGAGEELAVRKLSGGRFEVRGESEAEMIDLKLLTARGAKEFACKRGDFEVLIENSEEASVTAQVLHAGDAPVRVDLSLIPEGGGRTMHASTLFPQKTQRGTRVTWSAVAAGRYRLVGRVVGAANSFVELDGIEIGEGVKSDPRLESLSLGAVTSLELAFVDSAWNPIEVQLAGAVFVRRDAKHWEGVPVFSMKSHPIMSVLKGGADIRVCMSGYSPVTVFGAKGKTLVRLVKEKLISVPFVFGPVVFSSGEGALSVRLRPESAKGLRYTWVNGGATTGPNGDSRWLPVVSGEAIALSVPGAGSYAIELRRSKKSGGHDSLQPTPKSLVVTDTGVAERIAVRIAK